MNGSAGVTARDSIYSPMPYKPYWLQRLPEIIAALKGLPDGLIDRPTFETIFRLRRRRAIELMHSLGSCRGRRGYVLDRAMLLQRLESLNVLTQYRWEEQVRAERVIEQLNGTKAKPSNGSNGTHDQTRRIILEFADRGELTQKLLNLLRAACEGSGDSADVMTASKRVQYGLFRASDQSVLETELSRGGRLVCQSLGWARPGNQHQCGELSPDMQTPDGTALHAGIVR